MISIYFRSVIFLQFNLIIIFTIFRVLACLMDNSHNPKMNPGCREQVFHLQYFLARDFKYVIIYALIFMLICFHAIKISDVY